MAKRKKREPIEHILVWTISIGILPLFWGGGGLIVGLIIAILWLIYTINDGLK